MADDYRPILKPVLNKAEGFRDTVYDDGRGNPTTGYGFNLNDKGNDALLQLHGVDKQALIEGRSKLSQEQADAIQDSILAQKEKLVRHTVGSDLFDNLPANKKATLMSLGYNSINLLGPKLRQSVADNDDLNAAKEIMLNSNPKKELGILRRRSDEAKMYLGDDQYKRMNALLNDDERKQLQTILDKSDNENVKREYLNDHGTIFEKPNAPQPLAFNNLFKK